MCLFKLSGRALADAGARLHVRPKAFEASLRFSYILAKIHRVEARGHPSLVANKLYT